MSDGSRSGRGPAAREQQRGPQAGSQKDDSAPDPLRRSSLSRVWAAVLLLAVVLVVLIIFIAQNTERVGVQFLAWEGTTPLAVALLIAAAGGMFLTAMAAILRMLQVRRRVRRQSH